MFALDYVVRILYVAVMRFGFGESGNSRLPVTGLKIAMSIYVSPRSLKSILNTVYVCILVLYNHDVAVHMMKWLLQMISYKLNSKMIKFIVIFLRIFIY